MPDERPLSDRCSLMKRPGDPPGPKERPSECPEGAAYIRLKHGGSFVVHDQAPFPVIVEGDEGDDEVTVIGGPGDGVRVIGGAGDDRVTVAGGPDDAGLAAAPRGLIMEGSEQARTRNVVSHDTLAALSLLIVLIAVVLITWRALGRDGRD